MALYHAWNTNKYDCVGTCLLDRRKLLKLHAVFIETISSRLAHMARKFIHVLSSHACQNTKKKNREKQKLNPENRPLLMFVDVLVVSTVKNAVETDFDKNERKSNTTTSSKNGQWKFKWTCEIERYVVYNLETKCAFILPFSSNKPE